MLSTFIFVCLAVLTPQAFARTDLSGCVSSQTVAYGGASLIWYVPDTGEICSFLDCGGGRAPPKTTVPGCGGYTGTATVTPSFLPGFGSSTIAAAVTSVPSNTQTITSAPRTTDEGTTLTGTRTTSGASQATQSGVSSSTGTGSASTSTRTSSGTNSVSSASTSSTQNAAMTVPSFGTKGLVGIAVGVLAGAIAL